MLARIMYEGHPGPRPSGAGAYILAPARMCTSTLSFECKILIVMTMLVRSRSYSLHHRPLCGFYSARPWAEPCGRLRRTFLLLQKCGLDLLRRGEAMPRPQSFIPAPPVRATHGSPLRCLFRKLVHMPAGERACAPRARRARARMALVKYPG